MGFCLEYTLAEHTKQRFNKISNCSPKHSLVAGFVYLSEESICALILHFDPLCKPLPCLADAKVHHVAMQIKIELRGNATLLEPWDPKETFIPKSSG